MCKSKKLYVITDESLIDKKNYKEAKSVLLKLIKGKGVTAIPKK